MKRFLSVMLGLTLTFNVLFVAPAFALLEGSKQAVCKGIALDGNATCTDPAAAATQTQDVISKALNIFSVVIGIIAVVMIMIGGIKYVTSQGDSGQVNSAKNTILYAVIGLVIAMISQLIVRFVLIRFKT